MSTVRIYNQSGFEIMEGYQATCPTNMMGGQRALEAACQRALERNEWLVVVDGDQAYVVDSFGEAHEFRNEDAAWASFEFFGPSEEEE